MLNIMEEKEEEPAFKDDEAEQTVRLIFLFQELFNWVFNWGILDSIMLIRWIDLLSETSQLFVVENSRPVGLKPEKIKINIRFVMRVGIYSG